MAVRLFVGGVWGDVKRPLQQNPSFLLSIFLWLDRELYGTPM
jgi:hypothetical protein